MIKILINNLNELKFCSEKGLNLIPDLSKISFEKEIDNNSLSILPDLEYADYDSEAIFFKENDKLGLRFKNNNDIENSYNDKLILKNHLKKPKLDKTLAKWLNSSAKFNKRFYDNLQTYLEPYKYFEKLIYKNMNLFLFFESKLKKRKCVIIKQYLRKLKKFEKKNFSIVKKVIN